MAIDLSALSAVTTAASALSGLVLVSPQSTIGYQPQNPPDPNASISTMQPPEAFVFHYEGEQRVTCDSDITDHYVEDNTAVEDQIALKPEIISTHGFIGELNDVPPFPLAILQTAAQSLTAIGAYAPELSTTALLAYAEAFQLYQTAQTVANTAVGAWNLATGQGGESVIGSNGIQPASSQNQQQTAFQKLYGYWRKRTLFTVQTPWAVFQNMAILHMSPIQSADSEVITDFEITFKMIRVASTIGIAPGSQISYSGQLNSQGASLQDNGVTSGTESPISFASSIAGIAA